MAEPALLKSPTAGIRLRLATRVMPMHADEPCGDAAASFALAGDSDPASPHRLLVIVDGLGHGLEAAMAAQAAIDLIGTQPDLPLDQHLQRLEARLMSTRGAALGLVRIDGTRLTHAGVGNTRALHLRGAVATRLPSLNGIVGGGQTLRVSLNSLDLLPGDWLLLFTDGIDERVQLPVELPEWRRDPDTLCQHLMSQWHGARDDAGALALFVDAGDETGEC